MSKEYLSPWIVGEGEVGGRDGMTKSGLLLWEGKTWLYTTLG